MPDDIDGPVSATGTGTHDPAFNGEVKVQTAFDITAPLIAVDGKVYAKLPFSEWSTIDPAGYGAPDPAELLNDRRRDLVAVHRTENPEEGDETRDGETVLTDITGTLPGEAMQDRLPVAG